MLPTRKYQDSVGMSAEVHSHLVPAYNHDGEMLFVYWDEVIGIPQIPWIAEFFRH